MKMNERVSTMSIFYIFLHLYTLMHIKPTHVNERKQINRMKKQTYWKSREWVKNTKGNSILSW